MDKQMTKSQLGLIIMLGAVWGLSEAALGMNLKTCASFASGSIMTSVALFFIAASWVVFRDILGVTLLVVITSLFKMFDALLLSLPLKHGAVVNPIFAFVIEGIAFFVMVKLIKVKLMNKLGGRALLGGIAALLAVNLFPLVKYATGIPACVFPGTSYPLSLYYAPLAISLSLITVPLGFWIGAKIRAFEVKFAMKNQHQVVSYLAALACLIFCIALITFIRFS